jgi:hypothetical protein
MVSLTNEANTEAYFSQNRDGYLITAPRALTVVSLWSFPNNINQRQVPSDTGARRR